MEKENLDIQVLLDIALNQRVSGDLDQSIVQILNIYLRKLSCFSVAIYSEKQWQHVIPNSLIKSETWRQKLSDFAENHTKSDSFPFEFSIENNFFYGFSLSSYGWMLLARKNPFSKLMFFELNKLTHQLGKDLCQVKEEQRLMLLQHLFDKASDGIQIVEESGKLYYINDEASKRLGIDSREIKSYHIWDFEQMFFQNPDSWKAHVQEIKQKEKLIIEGTHINQITKEQFPVEITINFISVEDKSFIIASSRDISVRKQQETQIKETSQKLESIFNEMSDVVWSLKYPELTPFFITPSINNLLEESTNSINFNIEYWNQKIHYEDVGVIRAIKNSLFKKGNFNVKHRIFTSTGQVKWVRNKGKFIYNPDGQPTRLDGVISDRTQQYVAQESLDQEILLQEALIDIASTYINLDPKEVENTIYNSLQKMGLFVSSDRAYIFDYDFDKETTSNTYEWCNDGIEPEIMNLQDVPILFFPQWIEKHKKGEAFYIQDVFKLNDEDERGLKEILMPQGIKSLITIPLIDSNELIGFVGFDSVRTHHQYTEKEKRLLFLFGQMLINIRNRQKWDNQLRIQEEKYRNIIANMNLGLIEVDLNGIIMFANQSFCEMSGYDLRELKNQHINSFFKSDQKKQIENHAYDQLSSDHSISLEIEIFRKNKEARWWFISSAPQYNDKGQLMGSIVIHLDITEQKKLEQELAKAKTFAEAAAKAKELFLANMSHEIRTPLNVIIGMIRQLTKENLTQDQHFYVKQSESSAKHLLTILNNVLDIAKIESGDMEIICSSFSPSALAYNVHSIMYSQASEKNLSFILQVDPEIKTVLKGDETRLRQVLINLVGNGIKFTEKGLVRLSLESVGLNQEKQKIRFEVQDTGIGMSELFIEKLFDKFSQEYNEANRKYEGTGLGMAISKDLIQLMGGQLEVKSDKNEGTIFSFEIEFEIGNTQGLFISKSQFEEGIFKGKKALLVEDNEMNRFIAIQSLSFLGFETVEAENGLLAIQKLQETTFDMILMDIQMPVMDGLEATQHIREKLKIKTPILALTANAFKHDIDLYLKSGMDDFITKPYDENEFFRKIEYVMNLSSQNINQVVQDENTPRLFNTESLEILSRGDHHFVLKMLSIFKKSSIENITKMQTYIESNDWISMKKLAHTMKPSIDQLEIVQLKEVIRWLEQFDGDSDLIALWETKIRTTIEVLTSVINDFHNQ